MPLKDTVNTMKKELAELCRDLEKSTTGNKAAAQRVRTGTVRFARISKLYRKESVAAEKKELGKKGKKATAKPLKKRAHA